MKLPPGHVAGQGVAQPKCTGGFGERMLASMGWQAGEGLGKEGKGIKQAIQVEKKEDTVGVGGNSSYAWGDKWWEKAFDSAVTTVGDDTSDSSDSDSDDEHVAAAVNRDGTRTSASADELKLLASLSKGGRLAAGRFGGRDAKMARIREQEARLAAEAAAKLGVPSAAAAGAAGAGGKVASDRSDTTSEAQLSGASSGRKGKGSKGAGKSGGEPSSSGGGKKRGRSDSEDLGSKQQQEAQPERPAMFVVRRPMPASCRPAAPPAPKEGRDPGWWHACFHKAAGLGGVGAQAAAQAGSGAGITVHGFSEEDQTNLYNLAHDKATQGRVGLGRSSMPKKVAGVRWEGKKTRIQDSDEEGSDGEQSAEEAVLLFRRQEGREVGPAPAGVELEREEGLVIILPASKRHLLDSLPDCEPAQQQRTAAAVQQQQQQQQQAGQADGKPSGKKRNKGKQAREQPAASSSDAVGGIKWKKAVAAALKASPKGRLKLGKLLKAIAREAGLPKAQRPAALEALTAFLQQSSKFELADGVVRPVAAS